MDFDNKLRPKGIQEEVSDDGYSYVEPNAKKIVYKLNGGYIDLISYPSGKVAIIDYFVPENQRNQGIGTNLLKHALAKYPNLVGQFSGDQALKIAYKLGMKGEDENLEQALTKKRKYGSYFAEGK